MVRNGLLGLLLACGLLAGGCAGAGSGMGRDEDEKVTQTYSGLRGQLVGIMVWADWRTRTEYNRIQYELASLLQKRLEERAQRKDSKKAELGETRFVNPGSIVRYQREHPEIDGVPIEEVAPRLGASRVIYIEIEEFQAQSPESIMMLQGKGLVTLRVLEVADGKAKLAFEERGITARYPRNAPEGVVMSDKVTVRTVYEGTLNQLADRLAARFVEKDR